MNFKDYSSKNKMIEYIIIHFQYKNLFNKTQNGFLLCTLKTIRISANQRTNLNFSIYGSVDA